MMSYRVLPLPLDRPSWALLLPQAGGCFSELQFLPPLTLGEEELEKVQWFSLSLLKLIQFQLEKLKKPFFEDVSLRFGVGWSEENGEGDHEGGHPSYVVPLLPSEEFDFLSESRFFENNQVEKVIHWELMEKFVDLFRPSCERLLQVMEGSREDHPEGFERSGNLFFCPFERRILKVNYYGQVQNLNQIDIPPFKLKKRRKLSVEEGTNYLKRSKLESGAVAAEEPRDPPISGPHQKTAEEKKTKSAAQYYLERLEELFGAQKEELFSAFLESRRYVFFASPRPSVNLADPKKLHLECAHHPLLPLSLGAKQQQPALIPRVDKGKKDQGRMMVLVASLLTPCPLSSEDLEGLLDALKRGAIFLRISQFCRALYGSPSVAVTERKAINISSSSHLIIVRKCKQRFFGFVNDLRKLKRFVLEPVLKNSDSSLPDISGNPSGMDSFDFLEKVCFLYPALSSPGASSSVNFEVLEWIGDGVLKVEVLKLLQTGGPPQRPQMLEGKTGLNAKTQNVKDVLSLCSNSYLASRMSSFFSRTHPNKLFFINSNFVPVEPERMSEMQKADFCEALLAVEFLFESNAVLRRVVFAGRQWASEGLTEQQHPGRNQIPKSLFLGLGSLLLSLFTVFSNADVEDVGKLNALRTLRWDGFSEKVEKCSREMFSAEAIWDFLDLDF